MELLLKRRLDVNSLELKVAPIHSIVLRKRRDKIELLLALLTYSNADVDLKTTDGMAALHLVAQVSGSLVPRPSNTRTSPVPQLQKCGNEKRVGRVWQITMPGSVLTVGMLPHVLMRERTSVQPISVQVGLMTGSKYTVEHRNFENWSSEGPIVLKI